MDNNDRESYRTDNALADWWAKDGAWHVALPDPAREGKGLFWTDKIFDSRQEAIDYINSDPEYT